MQTIISAALKTHIGINCHPIFVVCDTRSFLTLTACDTTPTAAKRGKKGNIKTCRCIDGGGGWGGTLSANITKGSDRTNVNGQKEGMTHLTAATGSFLIASSHFKETRSTLGQ